MNKQLSRRIIRERVINVLDGDLSVGGLSIFLEAAGYSEQEIRFVANEYEKFVHQLIEKQHRKKLR